MKTIRVFCCANITANSYEALAWLFALPAKLLADVTKDIDR
jgi:hypothetical protein